jgi:hypothetical protein
MAVYPTWVKLTQASALEKFVELTCDMPLPALASFLGYNLLLEAVCAVLAFKVSG